MPHITRNGVKVFYESFGQGANTLVFLHPWTTNHYIWPVRQAGQRLWHRRDGG